MEVGSNIRMIRGDYLTLCAIPTSTASSHSGAGQLESPAATIAAAECTAERSLSPGMLVEIAGVHRRSDLNGQCGKLVEWLDAEEYWTVRMVDGTGEYRLRAVNLRGLDREAAAATAKIAGVDPVRMPMAAAAAAPDRLGTQRQPAAAVAAPAADRKRALPTVVPVAALVRQFPACSAHTVVVSCGSTSINCELIRGTFSMVGSSHGRPAYRRDSPQAWIYFWDMRDGKALSGWWIGPEVGSDPVYAHHHEPLSQFPPFKGWKLQCGKLEGGELDMTIQCRRWFPVAAPASGAAKRQRLLPEPGSAIASTEGSAGNPLAAAQDTLRQLADHLPDSQLAKDLIHKLGGQLTAARTLELRHKQDLLSLRQQVDHLQVAAHKAHAGHAGGAHVEYSSGGEWYNFEPSASIQILEKFTKDTWADEVFEIESGGKLYRIDIKKMTQTNVSTRKCREIRVHCGVPSSWKLQPWYLLTQAEPYHMFVHEPRAVVWEACSDILCGTGHGPSASFPDSACSCLRNVEVCEVYRVENFSLWHEYVQFMKAMHACAAKRNAPFSRLEPLLGVTRFEWQGACEKLQCSMPLAHELNEMMLLHGTTWPAAEQIMKEGFDHRVCRDRSMYGQGTYFTSEACKSHQYTCKQRGHMKGCLCAGVRWVVISRVLLGSPHYTTSTCAQQKRPPKDLRGDVHDSIVANPGYMVGHRSLRQSHQEFVIFKHAQAYPAFVFGYKVS